MVFLMKNHKVIMSTKFHQRSFFVTLWVNVTFDIKPVFWGVGRARRSRPPNTQKTDFIVTPGNPGEVIGQTGYVLFASTPGWGRVPHELWMRPFTFEKK